MIKKNYQYLYISILYLLGFIHWIFFLFFVDYYSYTNISPTREINKVLKKNYSIQQKIYEINKTRKDDKQMLKSFVTEKNVKKLFQYRYFSAHDWIKENKLQEVIGKSLRTFSLPYHIPNLPILYPATEQFLGAVHFSMSPQTILLLFFNSQVFTVINILLLYSVGFYGCLLLKEYYSLGFWSFTLFFLLFNFNGYFIEKISAYAPGQLGYFFMPYFVYIIFRTFELNQSDYRAQIRMGIYLGIIFAAMLFQGSLHLYVECITFVLIWGIVNFRYWRNTLTVFVVTFSLGMVRLLPAAVSYGIEGNPRYNVWGGYSQPNHFVDAFVDLRTQLDWPIYAWWESSLYVSVPGLFMLLYFGMWATLLRLEWVRFKGWKALVLPCFIILIISFRNFKHYIIPNWIPLLNAESVTTRYMIIPLVIVSIIAAINLQGFIQKYWQWKRVKYVMIFCISALALFLFNHSRLWRMHKVQNEFDWYNSWNESERIPQEIAANTQLLISNNMNDTLYIAAFWFGLVFSILSSIIVVWWLWWKPKITE